MIPILLKQKKCWYLDDAGLDLWSGTSLIQRVLLNLVKPVLFKKKYNVIPSIIERNLV